MRHANAHRKLNRTWSHRKAMLANMACSLVEHEQIKTTLPKAKELRPYLEKLITIGKRGDLARRAIIDANRVDEAALDDKVEDKDAETRRKMRGDARADARQKTLDALKAHMGGSPSADEVAAYFTEAKRDDLHAYRLLEAKIQQKPAVEKIMRVLAQRYAERDGGYVRVLKAGFRYGDMAPMAIIELVDRDPDARGKGDRDRVAREEAMDDEE